MERTHEPLHSRQMKFPTVKNMDIPENFIWITFRLIKQMSMTTSKIRTCVGQTLTHFV
jgi:hypothetical protein